ncbi:TetR/AcrR family transcriptional regulator [Actinocrispum sp. NPDC049592]|uniref:TetR/AcrR family transcriptional regulator n=1 Tax=Actinocrispum sp. NPDC049592 TaxID=3154835 RepID=UPI00343F6C35
MAKGTYNRRERPAKPALTREGIVATALDVMRAEGVERVTMRRLAQELDTGPASLYVYVRDTEELHAAVLDELLGHIPLTDTGGDWRTRLWTVLMSYQEVLYTNPSLARVALVTKLTGPNYLAVLDTVLALLTEGGMAPGQAAWAVDILLLMFTASAVEHGTQQQKGDGDKNHEALIQALDTVSPDRYPFIAELGPDLVSGPPEARARWTFDTLLNGAMTTPRPAVG